MHNNGIQSVSYTHLDVYKRQILSDRSVDAAHAAIPSLLAVSAVHHHLISVQKRVQTALSVESGEIQMCIRDSFSSNLS